MFQESRYYYDDYILQCNGLLPKTPCKKYWHTFNVKNKFIELMFPNWRKSLSVTNVPTSHVKSFTYLCIWTSLFLMFQESRYYYDDYILQCNGLLPKTPCKKYGHTFNVKNKFIELMFPNWRQYLSVTNVPTSHVKSFTIKTKKLKLTCNYMNVKQTNIIYWVSWFTNKFRGFTQFF